MGSLVYCYMARLHIQVLIWDRLRTVMIQCGGMDAASSLLMHWWRLWLWCIDVPGLSYHHIGKVTFIDLSRRVLWCINTRLDYTFKYSYVTGWGRWWSNVAVWMQPVAYWCTDVSFSSELLMCLDFHITTLAKSQYSTCHDGFFGASIQG